MNIILNTLSKSAWQLLGDYLKDTQLLGSIESTLYWDQNTSMPISGSTWRGEQLRLIAKQLHSRQSSSEFEFLIKDAKSELNNLKEKDNLESQLITDRFRNIELLEQDLKRQKSLDPQLVAQLATAKSEGYMLWQAAKKDNDFKSFAPALEKLILLRKEQSIQLNEQRSCWETLAQPFEPNLTINRVKQLFDPLRKRLPELIDKAATICKRKSQEWDLSNSNQEKICEILLNDWSRDPSKTAIAKSPHPFSITLGPEDYRITTRIVKGQPLSCLLATAHEWGHSLYEQGLPSESHQWFSWPLGQATSMAVHESQSLFWENRIARSLSFANLFWHHFERAGAPIHSGNDLWMNMNTFTPGLNRVEADELSYGLHIMIRTDLEIDLLENGLPVEDLPIEWNKRYLNLLGVSPKTDTEGCLQDVHWSEGMFGYFPSYLLGHLISAQLTNTLEKDIGNIEDIIETRKISEILDWLRENVHHYGRSLDSEELVKNVSGSELSPNHFLEYLDKKVVKLSTL
tara:strand:- start:1550 stop:3094 length:1545 start_codon:yes stop_codon:yes gene_type:complete